MGYYIGIITLICCNIVVVTGLSLLTGFTGIFSFGHAAFMALGAYTSAILTTRLGLPVALALRAAVTVAAAAGRLIGIPTLKLVGDYFAIAMLGLGETTRLLFDNGGELTGGARGFGNIPDATTLPAALLLMIASVIVMKNIIGSRYGRSFMAIREDSLAAECCGVDTFGMKKISLTVSAAFGGLGGAMFAHYLTYIQPIMFDMAKSTEIAASVVFGGLGSLSGSIIATVILVGIPEFLRPLFKWRLVFYGLVLVGTIVLRPQGLMGGKEITWAGIRDFFRRFTRKNAGVDKEVKSR
ncbi:MAG: branched-chain amino acid ABC transporter permease [Peptococcaceae bacterium]|nr:branched-chain amino acid ABC transporter permease [Peptococcaceae bacterium]